MIVIIIIHYDYAVLITQSDKYYNYKAFPPANRFDFTTDRISG